MAKHHERERSGEHKRWTQMVDTSGGRDDENKYRMAPGAQQRVMMVIAGSIKAHMKSYDYMT